VGVGGAPHARIVTPMNIRIEEGAFEVCATLYLYFLPLATEI